MNIINLSSHTLTEAEKEVLSLGLSFCPSRSLDNFEVVKDIFLFARKLLFKSMYTKTKKSEEIIAPNLKTADFKALRDLNLLLQENEGIESSWLDAWESDDSEEEKIDDSKQHKQFKRKSHRFPALSQNPALALFVKQTAKEIESLNKDKSIRNLTPEQQNALHSLKNNLDITIKGSDKGGNIVLMDNSKYEEMCLKILNNRKCYRKISASLVDGFNQEFYRLVDEAFIMGAITGELLDFIRTKHPRIPTMYALPKVHKDLHNPPGRPIISGNGSISEGISQVIDQHLRPHVLELASYTKDTIHLLQVLENLVIPESSILVTIDVESLYNSIPHDLGVAAVGHVLRQKATTEWKFNNFILEMLDFILRHNVFLFRGSHYLQVQGVAMGTCCAPSYANLYLGEWEKGFLTNDELTMYTEHVILWQRYIDDIFLIWNGPEEALKSCLKAMNHNTMNLFFTMSYDHQQINFLDVTIYKDKNGQVASKLYRKETAGNTLLHADSFHPEPLKKSIPFSQFLRLKRNCTTMETFQCEADKLSKRLLIRGYTKSSLKKAFNRVKNQDRHTLIFGSKTRKSDDTIRIILRYSNEHSTIRRILTKHWSILTDDPVLGSLLTSKPQITFRKAGSLADLLTQSEYKGNQRGDPCKTWGTFPCGNCSFCNVIGKRTTFLLPNGERFQLKHFANCQTQGVVYLVQCQCGAFYIGKTRQEFRQRVSKHLLSMQIGNLYLPLGRHVAKGHGYRMPSVNFTVVDRVHVPLRGGDWNKILLQREMRWIRHLNATTPPGLNEAESFRPFLEGFSSGKTD